MPTLPKSLLWRRTDVAGADHALIDDARGLYARGTAVAAAPVPYTRRFELVTDEGWATARLDVTAEGAGWLRTARLERAAGRWRVTTAEQGDLDRVLIAAGHPRAALPGTEEPERLVDAADVDLGAAPLFNTLPVRRLGLLSAQPGTERSIVVVRVLVPSLQVIAAEQSYAVLDGGGVRFSSRSFTTRLSLDAEGYVTRYPGLAERAS